MDRLPSNVYAFAFADATNQEHCLLVGVADLRQVTRIARILEGVAVGEVGVERGDRRRDAPMAGHRHLRQLRCLPPGLGLRAASGGRRPKVGVGPGA